MSETLDFILKRAEATGTAQTSVKANWEWDEKPTAQWATDIQGVRDARAIATGLEIDQLAKRETLDAGNLDLHKRTIQGVAMAKYRYRNDPVKLGVVRHLTARGDSRDTIAKEALAWENAWNQLEPAWSPTATNTLAAFKTLRGQCVGFNDKFTEAHTKWVAAAETINHLAATLDGDSVTWYGEATRVFAAGTVEGDMIRRTVPTTYTPPPVTPK